MQPPLRRYLQPITPDMLFRDDARTMLEFLQQNPDFTGREADKVDELRPIADYAKILSVAYEELYQGLDTVELQNEASRQQARLIENYVKTQKLNITDKLASADEATTRTLLQQVKQLDQLLNIAK
jgi:hypothetical protein